MTQPAPVAAWESDFDVLDPAYIADPFTVWDELRTACPIAHTERRGSTWLPTRFDDVTAIAHDIDRFSSLQVAVIPFQLRPSEEGREPRPALRAPAHLGRPTPAHMDAAAAVAVVLAPSGGGL